MTSSGNVSIARDGVYHATILLLDFVTIHETKSSPNKRIVEFTMLASPFPLCIILLTDYG